MKGAPDILTTPHLILRPFEKDDAGSLAELLDNFEIYMNTTCIPFPYTLEDAESFISRRQELFNADRSATWAVTEADGCRLVGGISLELDLPAQKAEMGTGRESPGGTWDTAPKLLSLSWDSPSAISG